VSDTKTISAPLTFVQASQINAQIPWDIVPNGASGTVNVIVTRDGAASSPSPVQVAPFSPGVFASNGRAIAVNSADGTLAWPAGLIPGLTTHAAKPGDTLIVYATGLGAVDNPVENGHNPDKLTRTITTPVVMIGGLTAQVGFSGLAPQFVGVNQLNVVVPNVVASDSVPFQIAVGGTTTSDKVTIAVSK
jgi:uncharacterized protein (TIGR03437 family)